MLRFDSCPNCFAPLHGQADCPACGYNYFNDKKQPKGVLEPFAILSNRYIVGRVLGKGGFGVTYVALDMIKNIRCAVKEYMPAEYSKRGNGTKNLYPMEDAKSKYVFNHGRDKFVEEARTLITLKNNPIVVDILDYFTENNTAYLAMEYLDGSDLRKLAKQSNGKIDAEFAKVIFVTIASALTVIHKQNILHRDLSPENIFVTKNGDIKLIDFGAARNFVSNQNKGMSILLKPGFAPPEQYSMDGVQGPWTDVYALCATFYNIVSGQKLIDAMYRYRGQKQPTLYELGCPVSKKTSDVIAKGMELEYKNRYKNFSELLNDIDIVTSNRSTKKEQAFEHKKDFNKISYERQSYSNKYNKNADDISEVNTDRRTSQRKKAPLYTGILLNNMTGQKVKLTNNIDFKIGRSVNSCDYVVSGDKNISRVQCTVYFDKNTGAFYITDYSSNGTFFADNTRLVKNRKYRVYTECSFYLVTPNHSFTLLSLQKP